MKSNIRLFVVAGLLVGLGLALFVSPFASSSPDGLEKVAAEEGFDGTAIDHRAADSPLADYGVEGIDNARASTGLSGVIGVLITFGVGLALFAAARTVRTRSPRSPDDRRRMGSPAA